MGKGGNVKLFWPWLDIACDAECLDRVTAVED